MRRIEKKTASIEELFHNASILLKRQHLCVSSRQRFIYSIEYIFYFEGSSVEYFIWTGKRNSENLNLITNDLTIWRLLALLIGFLDAQ